MKSFASEITQSAADPAGLGLHIPQICMPRTDIDLSRWAVVACDQHTTDPAFWRETEKLVGREASALHMILPEVYLEQPGETPVPERIEKINQYMRQAEQSGLLRTFPSGCMLVDRMTPDHTSRKGLVIAIDLEQYDFTPGNKKLVRASEGTVVERIPPRMAVRRDAIYELPHVQLLFDDPTHQVLEPLAKSIKSSKINPDYEAALMQNGGYIKGWFVEQSSPLLSQLLLALSSLSTFNKHHLLFAVGDGNHSLATAKAHWESIRDRVDANHPARFALVEIINIHDSGLEFEPIHRIIFDVEPVDLLTSAKAFFAGQKLVIDEILQQQLRIPDCSVNQNCFQLFSKGKSWILTLNNPSHFLSAGSVQNWLDHLAETERIRLDYVHGLDAVNHLSQDGNVGLILPALSKNDFFPTIVREGVLPRKTFSMGAPYEKRYYIEARKIR